MNNIWNNGFQEPAEEFPEILVQRIINPFESITENFASLNLESLDQVYRITSGLDGCEFQFSLQLISKQLRGYSFEVFKFGYSVSLYPVKILAEEDIGSEVNARRTMHGFVIYCTDEQAFVSAVTAILQSNKFKNTVGGLIKIAKKNIETSTLTPPRRPKM